MAVYSRERFALRDGVANDFVVDVGDVHDVVEGESASAQPTAQQVVEDEGAEVADVGEVVDGGAAGIHLDGVVFEGAKRLHLLGQRVIETQGHEGELSW